MIFALSRIFEYQQKFQNRFFRFKYLISSHKLFFRKLSYILKIKTRKIVVKKLTITRHQRIQWLKINFSLNFLRKTIKINAAEDIRRILHLIIDVVIEYLLFLLCFRNVYVFEKKNSGNYSFLLSENYLFFKVVLGRLIFGFCASCDVPFCNKWRSKDSTFFMKVSLKKRKLLITFFPAENME